MRIGIFSDTYTPDVNGVATSINTVTEELKRQGQNVFIFAPNSSFKWEVSFEKQILKLPSVKFYGDRRFRLGIPLLLRNKLKGVSLDVVHTQTPFPIGIAGLWFALSHKLPLVHTYHTRYQTYDHYLHLPEFMRKATVSAAMQQIVKFLNKHDVVIAPALGVKRELISFGVERPINVIPTGINIERILGFASAEPPKDIREHLHINPDAELVIFTSRIAKEKNIGFLLHSMKRVLQARPQVRFLIIGDGKEKDNLKTEAERLGVANQVIFCGFLKHEEMFGLYKMGKVFVFSSTTETQGLVLLEAMAVGLPVVALKATGTEDVVDETNGYLVDTPDHDRFAASVIKILSDAALREKKSKGALLRAQEFSVQKTTEKLLATYRHAVASHQGSLPSTTADTLKI